MALINIFPNAESYEALSSDIVNNSIVGLQSSEAVGKKVYITDLGKTYTILSDYTLSLYTNNSPRYLSQTQIGADINFAFLNSALVNNQATPIDITKPTSPSDEYEVIVYNPSNITDLTIKVFSTVTSLAAQTRYAYITTINVPKSATITGTIVNTYSFFVHGIFNNSNCRLQVSNDTVLGGSDGFTGTIRLREV